LMQADLRTLVERAGGELVKDRCACPIHGGDNPNGFAVFRGEDGRDMWKCFSRDCGGGDVISFVEVWQYSGYPEKDRFKKACLFLGGDALADPVEMEQLARARHKKAVEERQAAQAKEEARRKELQAEEKHLFYHNQLDDYFRAQWLDRGINESWQNFFSVGGCKEFSISPEHKTSTLTIQIYSVDYEVLNIKHRLLNPLKPTDKYRPERSGLGAFPPFFAFPDTGYDAPVTWVIEGEIKAMVTATITPVAEWQFVGVPGRSQYNSLVENLMGKNVIVVPDPGAEKDAAEFCKAVNGRWLWLPDKIDDMIVEQGYDGSWLLSMEKQARKA
jgi:hypothetical protein